MRKVLPPVADRVVLVQARAVDGAPVVPVAAHPVPADPAAVVAAVRDAVVVAELVESLHNSSSRSTVMKMAP